MLDMENSIPTCCCVIHLIKGFDGFFIAIKRIFAVIHHRINQNGDLATSDVFQLKI